MAFVGTVASDFLKLVTIPEDKKDSLIDHSVADFPSLKDALVEYIKAVYPLDYHNFVESDAGVMLIELVAYMGSVMSFKADFLANKNFLRTARRRNSVQKLFELIGIRMKGPISAAANAQVTIDSPSWDPGTSNDIIIPIENRAVTITSPQDGSPLSYTLYKVVNGKVDIANSTGGITLNTSAEANNNAGTEFTNLVLQEGSLVQETGTFASPESIKTIELAQSPVVEGSVDVHIDGGDSKTTGNYSEVRNIYFASGQDDKIFQLVSTDDFAATVVFGDNKLGLSPGIGDSYSITYRIGGGSRGNISNEVINTSVPITATTGNVNGVVQNISQGTGGANAETINHAKKFGPLSFRRQDRVVTLGDYVSFVNDFTSNFGSIGKATAITRRAYNSANIVDVFVLEKANDFQLRKATPTFKIELLEALQQKKMLTTEVIVVDGLIRTLDLDVTIRIDKELTPSEEVIKLQVSDIIREFFNYENSNFGKMFIAADLNRAIFNLPSVRFSTVDNVAEMIKVGFNEIIQLNNLSINIEKV